MAFAMPHPILRKNTWYLDVRIPADVLEPYRKYKNSKGDRVRKSLGTNDRAEAKKRFAEEYANLQNTFERLRSEVAGKTVRLSSKQITALAGIHYRDLLCRFEDDPPEVAQTRDTLTALGSIQHLRGRRGKWFRKVMDDMLNKEGLAIDEDSYLRLGEAFYEAATQAIEAVGRFAEGDYSPDPKGNRFPPWVPPEASREEPSSNLERPASELTIDSLFERWEKTHLANNKAQGTVADFRAKVEVFKSFVGHGNAERVSSKDVGAWVDYLLHEKGLSPKSIRGKYLAAVSSIFELGVGRGVIDNNPAKGIRVDIPKAQKTRERGYSDAEAAILLQAALDDPASLGGMAEWNKKAIRWVPWLCAYTGARVSEITQLHREDFEYIQGTLSIRITPEGGKSVKTGKYRRIPLHSHLLETGIIEFIRDTRGGPLFFEDPEDIDKRLDRARSAGEKVRKWVRNTVGLADKRIQPNHAWRHRFKTLCYNAGIETRYADAIQGHEDGNAASSYGDMEVLALKREIEKIPRQVML